MRQLLAADTVTLGTPESFTDIQLREMEEGFVRKLAELEAEIAFFEWEAKLATEQ